MSFVLSAVDIEVALEQKRPKRAKTTAWNIDEKAYPMIVAMMVVGEGIDLMTPSSSTQE